MSSAPDDFESECDRCWDPDCDGTCQGVWACGTCGKIDCNGLCSDDPAPYSSPAGGGGASEGSSSSK